MMKYVKIKELRTQEGELVYKVNAIVLESLNGENKKKIPHPVGTDVMIFSSIDKAKEAIILSGFQYVLPDGTMEEEKISGEILPYDKKVFDALMSQTKDSNPNIVAAAIMSLSEINYNDCLDLFIKKMGEENEIIRQNSIDAILKYGKKALPQVIKALDSQNWITRNSAVICIQYFSEHKDIELSLIIDVLLKKLQDTNPIVKCSVIKALGIAYKQYRKK